MFLKKTGGKLKKKLDFFKLGTHGLRYWMFQSLLHVNLKKEKLT